MKKNNNGLTLLEIMLVLILIATITLMAFRTYRKATFKQHIIMLQGSVNVLQDSLNRYFMANCATLSRRSTGQVISIDSDLIPLYLQNKALINNPFYLISEYGGVDGFELRIRWSNIERDWSLAVEAHFPEYMLQNQIAVIASETNPSLIMPHDEQMLVWLSRPDTGARTSGLGNSPLSDDLEQFAREQYATDSMLGTGVSTDPEGRTYPCSILDRDYLQQWDKRHGF